MNNILSATHYNSYFFHLSGEPRKIYITYTTSALLMYTSAKYLAARYNFYMYFHNRLQLSNTS